MLKQYTASETKLAYEMMLIAALLNSQSKHEKSLLDDIMKRCSQRFNSLYERSNMNNRNLKRAVEANAELTIAHIERKRKHREALEQRELMKANA